MSLDAIMETRAKSVNTHSRGTFLAQDMRASGGNTHLPDAARRGERG